MTVRRSVALGCFSRLVSHIDLKSGGERVNLFQPLNRQRHSVRKMETLQLRVSNIRLHVKLSASRYTGLQLKVL